MPLSLRRVVIFAAMSTSRAIEGYQANRPEHKQMQQRHQLCGKDTTALTRATDQVRGDDMFGEDCLGAAYLPGARVSPAFR